jgi:hypothetical protein
VTTALDALEHQSDALPDTDAHRAERTAQSTSFQFDQRGRGQPCAAHPQRMPERDGATIGVHVLGVVRQPQVTQDSKGLRRERFVQLDASASPAPDRSP